MPQPCFKNLWGRALVGVAFYSLLSSFCVVLLEFLLHLLLDFIPLDYSPDRLLKLSLSPAVFFPGLSLLPPSFFISSVGPIPFPRFERVRILRLL